MSTLLTNPVRGLKSELVQIIHVNMGKKTADLFDHFYHAENPQVLLTSADELLTEFMGREKARHQLAVYYKRFDIKPI